MGRTPSQTIGPFFHLCLTTDESAGRMAGPGCDGDALTIVCRVLDGEGQPVNDAMIELWQADARGAYNHPDDPQYEDRDPAFRGFGRLATDERGRCAFTTVKPGQVPAQGGAMQAPHINVSVFARGLLKRVVTRIYFAGEPSNAEDPILKLVPEQQRDTLLARPDPARSSVWILEIRLSGDRETAFFDL